MGVVNLIYATLLWQCEGSLIKQWFYASVPVFGWPVLNITRLSCIKIIRGDNKSILMMTRPSENCECSMFPGRSLGSLEPSVRMVGKLWSWLVFNNCQSDKGKLIEVILSRIDQSQSPTPRHCVCPIKQKMLVSISFMTWLRPREQPRHCASKWCN